MTWALLHARGAIAKGPEPGGYAIVGGRQVGEGHRQRLNTACRTGAELGDRSSVRNSDVASLGRSVAVAITLTHRQSHRVDAVLGVDMTWALLHARGAIAKGPEP